MSHEPSSPEAAPAVRHPVPPADDLWRDEDAESLPRAGFRGSGLVLLLLIVLIGGLPSVYYRIVRPQLEANYRAEVEAAPTTASGRLERWFEFGAAMIHHRIARVGRFSEEQPWIVTHAVRAEGDGGPVEAYGVDASRLTPAFSSLDGLTVVIDLPAPGPLGPLELVGERGRYVPVHAPEEQPADPVRRLRELTLWFLEGIPAALAEDIEGASLELRIGGQVVVPRRAASTVPPGEDPAEAPQAAVPVQPAPSDGR